MLLALQLKIFTEICRKKLTVISIKDLILFGFPASDLTQSVDDWVQETADTDYLRMLRTLLPFR